MRASVEPRLSVTPRIGAAGSSPRFSDPVCRGPVGPEPGEPDPILALSLPKGLTESPGDLRFGKAREVKLKGISETQQVHALEWQ